jgi:hypothetical protein
LLHAGVSIATDYGLDGLGLIPSSAKIFLSSAASRPAVGPTQPPYAMGTEGKAAGV